MPELPEVETIKRRLKKELVGLTIRKVDVYYSNIIVSPSVNDFVEKIKNQTIIDVDRKGKWLLFILDDYYLLSHLRMEGRYVYRHQNDEIMKHDHIVFTLSNDIELRYKDTRKFGRMYLFPKNEAFSLSPLKELGLEPWDKKLTSAYLLNKFKNKRIPIKTVLLDQKIIVGIGNIYADEILFRSGINPLIKACDINNRQCYMIIKYTKEVLEKAITLGGTTIRSYESSEGVHGMFQKNLLVHNHEGNNCTNCEGFIEKIKISGRSTYYCPNCQKKDN